MRIEASLQPLSRGFHAMLVDKIENMDSMGRLLVELQLVKGVRRQCGGMSTRLSWELCRWLHPVSIFLSVS